MNKEDKIKFAKEIYHKMGVVDGNYEIKRDDEINADYVYISDMRGPGGLIVADDGTFLFCQSAKGYLYWKEEFKKGNRSH